MLEQLVRDSRGDLGAVSPAQRIFMSDDYPIRLSHGVGNRLPVVRIESAQIDEFHADIVLPGNALSRLQRAWNRGTVRDQRHVLTFANGARLPEWNHVVRTRIWSASVSLAIQPLMLEEQHGIVAADRSAQQTVGVQSI